MNQDTSQDGRMIIRVIKDREHPYWLASRKAFQDSRLSFGARGLLAYLLSKPDGWELDYTNICKEGKIGRDQSRKLVTELTLNGYIHRFKERNKNGTWNYYSVVYDEPQSVVDESAYAKHPIGKGTVYLIECGGMYKIGISTNLTNRINSLKSGNPFTIKLVATIVKETIHEAAQIEESLHKYLKTARIHGEWFKLSDKQIAEVLRYFEQSQPLTENPSTVEPSTVEPRTDQPRTVNTDVNIKKSSESAERKNKEQQQQTDAAAAASAFSFNQIKLYVLATKAHSTNAGGLAKYLERTGEEDVLIREWLDAQQHRKAEDLNRTPFDAWTRQQHQIAAHEREQAWLASLPAITRSRMFEEAAEEFQQKFPNHARGDWKATHKTAIEKLIIVNYYEEEIAA